MSTSLSVLLEGVPATSSRGFAGIASVALLTVGGVRVLFDTASINDREGLREQLASLSLRAADIDVVVLSHLHFDHCGNAELFPDARLVVHGAELEFARQESPGYSAALTRVVAEHRGLEQFAGSRHHLLPGIELVHVPGHTPGSIALVTEVDGARTVLAGDALKNRAEMSSAQPAAPCNDPVSWRTSARSILTGDGTVVPGHDVPIAVDGVRIVAQRPGRRPWQVASYANDTEPLGLTAVVGDQGGCR